MEISDKQSLYSLLQAWESFMRSEVYSDILSFLLDSQQSILNELLAESTTKFDEASDRSFRVLEGNNQALLRILAFMQTRAGNLIKELNINEADTELPNDDRCG